MGVSPVLVSFHLADFPVGTTPENSQWEKPPILEDVTSH